MGLIPIGSEKCGNKLEDDAKFCNLCGTPVPIEEDVFRGKEAARNNMGGSSKKTVAAVCAVCTVLIAAGIVFGVMSIRKAEEREIQSAAQAEEQKPAGDVKKAGERPKEPADEKEQEPEAEVKDYDVDYREAYKEIVRQEEAGELGADYWALHDMDGDGMPELFVLEGRSVGTNRWVVYTYDIEKGTSCFLGEVATGSSMQYEPETREAGIVAVKGYMGAESVYSVKKAGKDGLNVTMVSQTDNVPGDYYSTPYPLQLHEVKDVDELGGYILGETIAESTGLRTPEGREVFKIPGDAYATSVLQEPDRKHSTEHLSDLNPATVWAEGAVGTGEGEAVVIDTLLPFKADGLAVLPGYCRDQAVYEKNGRPGKITVKCGDTVISREIEFFKPDFSDPLKSMIYIEFDEPVYTDRFTVTISRAMGGTQYEDMCIAELFPYSYTAEYN